MKYTIEYDKQVWWVKNSEGKRQAGFRNKKDLEDALDAEENRIKQEIEDE